LELPARRLPADLVEVELGAVEHVLADGGEGPGERGEEPDLDGAALGGGGQRPADRRGEAHEDQEGDGTQARGVHVASPIEGVVVRGGVTGGPARARPPGRGARLRSRGARTG